MQKDQYALLGFLLGVLLMSLAVLLQKRLDRLERHEHYEYERKNVFASAQSTSPDIEEMRKKAAHDFINDLREEGLIITEVTE